MRPVTGNRNTLGISHKDSNEIQPTYIPTRTIRWQVYLLLIKVILNDDKLEKYIIALTTKYPDKFLEMIKKDLKTEKDFLSSIAELEIDESVVQDEAGDDEAQSFTDEIRGTVESTAMDDDSDY